MSSAPYASQLSGIKILLHVGCGSSRSAKVPSLFRSEGWKEVRLDADPASDSDIVASMTSMPAVQSSSIAAIFSSHSLNKLYPHEVPVALKEFHRVLTPNGFVLLKLPDLQRAAELIIDGKLEDTAYLSSDGPVAPLDILYGHRLPLARGELFKAHRTGFTATTLAKTLLAAGFAQVAVRRDGSYGLCAIACRQPLPEEQITNLQKALSAID